MSPLEREKILAKLRAGPTAADALDAYWAERGLHRPTEEELANLPPWTEEEATAFERAVAEARFGLVPRAAIDSLASADPRAHNACTDMNATASPALSSPATSPAGSTATSVLDEFCRMMGIGSLSTEEAANLPPWTEEEASAFERHIKEAFEQVEDDGRPA